MLTVLAALSGLSACVVGFLHLMGEVVIYFILVACSELDL